MRLLSFDTSSETPSVALLEEGTIVCERNSNDLPVPTSSPAGSRAGSGPTVVRSARPEGSHKSQKAPVRQEIMTSLMPLIDSVMTECGWERDSLDCLAVCVGPGGFTGIRTGVVTARTIAQALNLPLIPVSSLESLASLCPLPVTIVAAAGRGHCFVAGYAARQAAATGSELAHSSPAPLTILTETVAPIYLPDTDIAAFLPQSTPCAVSPEVAPGVVPTAFELVSFPKVKNIATPQALLAWNRLSLILHEGGSDRPGAKMDLTVAEASSMRSSLLQQFPYTNVQPLYLRNPSITLKPAKTGNP